MKERKKLFSRLWDLPYGRTTPYHLFDASKNSQELVQKFQLQKKIPVHTGCVNSICWNENGRYLLSGSDDQHLSIVQGYDYSVLAYIQTGHRANIFSAKFLPNSGDSHVVSSSGDGIIIYSDLERSDTSLTNKFTCHNGTAYEIMTVPGDPNTFLSCGEDRTVRWFDIRTKTSCDIEDCKDDVLVFCRSPVTSIAVNPLIPYQLAIGCADSSVQIFDRRMLSTKAVAGYLSNGCHALTTYFTVPDFPQNRRITSLCYSADGREMLVSYSSDYIYLFDIKDDMGKKPKILSANGSGSYNRTRPLMKRLRVRGDWSDTGPNSRPETEAGGRDYSPNNLVRRMTDILTRMLFAARNRPSSDSHSSAESSPLASSHSEDGEMEAGADSNNHETARSNQPSETNNESSTQEIPAGSEHLNENVTCDNSESDQIDSNSSTSNCAFEQKNVETQPSSSLDMPSTSGLQSVSQNSAVIKDSCVKETSNLSEPATSSPSVSNQEIDSGNCTTQKAVSWNAASPMEFTEVENNNSVNAKKCQDNANEIAGSSGSTLLNEEPEDNYSCLCGPLCVNCNCHESNAERGSESETETAVQSIQRSENVPTISELQSPRSPSPEVLEDNAEEEVELMMEVDSWDSDSDDGSQARSSHSNRINRRRGRVSSSNEEIDPDQKDEVRKEKPPKNVTRPKVKKMFKGHRNARTMIKESTFWGDNFVMSGSDCGHIFIWDRHTTDLVMIMEADHHVVNCLQPHPFDPILASSGIDYDIKVWAPLREEPFFDVEKANEIVKRNEIMLEVTKDTITVPASFMFNMFNTLNHLRNGHRTLNRWTRASRSSRSEEHNR